MSEAVEAVGTGQADAVEDQEHDPQNSAGKDSANQDSADQKDADQNDADQNDAGADGGQDDSILVQEGDVAGDYLERLLDLLDYDGDIDLDVDAGRAVISIEGGTDLEKLVGTHGSVLEALQELTRLAVQQETGHRSRLMLDIAGWRAGRREELAELGRSTAETVRSNGEAERLRPMSPFERKIVHDAVAAVDGVYSESEGDNPKRRVVVHPE